MTGKTNANDRDERPINLNGAGRGAVADSCPYVLCFDDDDDGDGDLGGGGIWIGGGGGGGGSGGGGGGSGGGVSGWVSCVALCSRVFNDIVNQICWKQPNGEQILECLQTASGDLGLCIGNCQ